MNLNWYHIVNAVSQGEGEPCPNGCGAMTVVLSAGDDERGETRTRQRCKAEGCGFTLDRVKVARPAVELERSGRLR